MGQPKNIKDLSTRTLSLSDLLVTANPTNGLAGKSTLQALKDLVAPNGVEPITEYADYTALLANTDILSGYFALVTDASSEGYTGWALYQYKGGDRDELASYRLIISQDILTKAQDLIDDTISGAFTAYTGSTVTINPLKQLNNNYKWNLPSSSTYSLTWDFTDVLDGASGMIKIIKDNSATVRLIPVPTNTDLYDDSYSEENEVGASAKTITGAANNGSGLIRITATAHGYATSDRVNVASVVGTVEANGKWTITVIDANNFDLQSSAFVNTYISGGTATKLAKYLAIEQVANSINLLQFFETDGKMHAQLTKQVDVF
jgi:hypothetical protein